MLGLKKILNKKGIKAFGIVLGMMALIPAYASVSVSPTRIEIDANQVRSNYFTTAVTVRGSQKGVLRFKAYPGYFKINDQGKLEIVESSNDPHDISKKLRFVPSEFTIAPGMNQKLRINVAGIKNLPAGENRAILYLEDVNPKEMNFDLGQENMGAQLIVKTRVGIPIYIDSGKYTKIGEVEYLKATPNKDGIHTEMKILSQGNSKIRYNTKAQIIKGRRLVAEENLGGGVIADGKSFVHKEVIKTDSIKDSGEYTLRMIVSYQDEKGKLKYIKRETMINIIGKM